MIILYYFLYEERVMKILNNLMKNLYHLDDEFVSP